MRVVKNEKSMITMANISIPLSRAIILTSSADNAKYDSMRQNGVAYQIPVGFKLKIHAARFQNYGAASVTPSLGSATASVSNNTIPAGALSIAVGGYVVANGMTSAAAGSSFEVAVGCEIAEGRYGYTLGSVGPHSSQFLCELVAV